MTNENPEKSYQELKEKAEEAFLFDDAEKAIVLIEEAIVLYPSNSDPLFDLANFHMKLGDFIKAREGFQKGIDLEPNSWRALNAQGLMCKMRADYQSAIAFFKESIRLFPENAYTPLNNLGNAYLVLCEYKEADKVYNRAIELHPDNYLAFYNLGRSFMLQEDWKKAIETLELAEKHVNPIFKNRVFELYKMLGRCYANNQEYEKSSTILINALKLNTLGSGLDYEFGYLAYLSNEQEKAYEYFKRSINTSSSYKELYLLGDLYLNLKDPKKSIELYQQAIKVEPNGFFAGYKLGKYYARQEDWSNAIDVFTSLYNYIPAEELQKFYESLGQAYYENSQYDYAIAVYLRLIEIESNNPNYNWYLGIMYQSRSEFLASIPYFEKLVSLLPSSSTDYWISLVYACFSVEKPDLAIIYARQALTFFPDDPYFIFHLGRLLFETEQYKDAGFYIEKAILANPNEPEYYVYLGLLKHKRSEDANAVLKSFQKAYELSKNAEISDFSFSMLQMSDVLQSIGDAKNAKLFKEQALIIENKELESKQK